MPASASVLIVGAGPAGLALALTLLQNGVSVRIIDKLSEYRVGQKGPGVQPRTIEVYKLLGALPAFMKVARRFRTMTMYQLPKGTEPMDKLEVTPYSHPTADIPYPDMLALGQDRHEAMLRSELEKHNCFVELGTELRSFEQHPDHVVAHISATRDGVKHTESTNYAWLVGTDGAHSVVRKQLGLTFLGESMQQDPFTLGDIHVKKGLAQDTWHMWGTHGTKGVYARPFEIEGDDRFSVLMGGPQLEHVPSNREEFIEAFRAISGRNDVEFGNLVCISHWKPSVRMVNKFGEGRVYVAGDAAHVHCPTGGQGLNSGIQDSFNLGWKLALVHKGLAPTSLIDSYSTERLPVITAMLSITTAELQKMLGDDESRWKRSDDFKQLGVNYRGSPIVVDHMPTAGKDEPFDPYRSGGNGLRAGDRAPDSPGVVAALGLEKVALFDLFGASHHTVLLFSAEASVQRAILDAVKGYPQGTIKTVIIHPARGNESIPAANIGVDHVFEDCAGSAYATYESVVSKGLHIIVVRPDGALGALVGNVDGLKEYFKLIFV